MFVCLLTTLMISSRRISRNLVTRSSVDEVHLLCLELDQIYKDLSLSSFPNVEKFRVPMIKRALAEGCYKLSPLRSEIFYLEDPRSLFLHTEIMPLSYEVVRSTEEDDLVLRALAQLLEKKFLNSTVSEELGFRRYSSFRELFK